MNRRRWLQAVFLFVRSGRLDQRDLSRDSFEFMEYTWPMCHHISVTIFFATFWSLINYPSFTIGVLCKCKFGFFLFGFWAGKDYTLPRCGWQANKYFPSEYFLYLNKWITKLCKQYFLEGKTRHLKTGCPKNKWLKELMKSDISPHLVFAFCENSFFSKTAGCEGGR